MRIFYEKALNDEVRTVNNRDLIKDIYVLTGIETNNKGDIVGLKYAGTMSKDKIPLNVIEKYSNYPNLLKELIKICDKLS